MKIPAIFAACGLLASCATSVVHPTKTDAEMRTDVAACTDQANRVHEWDPFAALDYAYECLAKLGYERQHAGFEARVQTAVAADRVEKKQPPLSCVVPCRPRKD